MLRTAIVLALVAAPLAAAGTVKLPAAATKVGMSVEEALQARRSTKAYQAAPVSQAKLAQLLWATAGVNRPDEGKRTHPSALAKYTVDVYVCDGKGVFKYVPVAHELAPVAVPETITGDPRKLLPKRDYVKDAPVLILLVGDVTRLPADFAEDMRWNWVYCEAGTMCQNLHLQCAALGLGTCVNAGFDGDGGAKLLGLAKGSKVLFVLPVGYPEN